MFNFNNLFNLGNIITKFNKLQEEVDSYCSAQVKETQDLKELIIKQTQELEEKLKIAESDLAQGVAISGALKRITKGE